MQMPFKSRPLVSRAEVVRFLGSAAWGALRAPADSTLALTTAFICPVQAEDLDALKAKVQALSAASMKIGETLSQQGGGASSGGSTGVCVMCAVLMCAAGKDRACLRLLHGHGKCCRFHKFEFSRQIFLFDWTARSNGYWSEVTQMTVLSG